MILVSKRFIEVFVLEAETAVAPAVIRRPWEGKNDLTVKKFNWARRKGWLPESDGWSRQSSDML